MVKRDFQRESVKTYIESSEERVLIFERDKEISESFVEWMSS